MLLTVLLLFFLFIILYLLVVPVHLYIDTSRDQYFVEMKGLGKASMESDAQEIFKIKLKVFFFHFQFYPLKNKGGKRSKTIKTKPNKKQHRSKLTFKTAIRLLRSFKIKEFNIDIDTGDCISNAKLYPIFAFLNYKKQGFYINFQGRNTLLLSIENRPIRIIRSFINI